MSSRFIDFCKPTLLNKQSGGDIKNVQGQI
jgi:hypothetical protein